jgi:translation initiation factor 6
MAGLRQSLPVSDRRLKIAGSSLLGVFAECTEDFVLVPLETDPTIARALEESLHVKALRMVIAGSSVIGSLTCGNSKGFIVTPQANDEVLKKLSELGQVARLPGKTNAAGNIILANDKAALVHPGLSERACQVIRKTLDVEIAQGTIGGLRTVGMAGVATNKGLLVHPRVSEAELTVLRDLFGIPVDIGTVNFSSPLVGSGVLANSKGYVAGLDTMGPELGRIDDALGFL